MIVVGSGRKRTETERKEIVVGAERGRGRGMSSKYTNLRVQSEGLTSSHILFVSGEHLLLQHIAIYMYKTKYSI